MNYYVKNSESYSKKLIQYKIDKKKLLEMIIEYLIINSESREIEEFENKYLIILKEIYSESDSETV